MRRRAARGNSPFDEAGLRTAQGRRARSGLRPRTGVRRRPRSVKCRPCGRAGKSHRANSKGRGRCARLRAILVDAIETFLAEDGWAIASYIALTTLTSLFPFLIFVTALAGFLGTQDLADEATRLIFSAWPEAVARPIAGEVHDVLTAPRGGLLTIGVVLALYFSTSAIEALRVGLNRAYASPERRPWWLLRLQSLMFTLVASVGLLALAFFIVLGPLIWATTLSFVPAVAPLQVLVTFTRIALATLLLAITLVIAHRWLPARRLRFIDIAPGVVVTFVSCIVVGGRSATISANSRAATSRPTPASPR